MVKIGVLLPEKEMVDTAKRIIDEYKIEITYLKAIRTEDTVNEARTAVDAGSHILVARGYQAKIIKHYTSIPLVEMRFHAQEIGILIQKAKVMVKKEHPVIGLIAFDNMLCDLSHMEELFSVTLEVVLLDRIEDAAQALQDLSVKSPDIIIGGEENCAIADKMGYPTLFYQSTEESLLEALKTAQSTAFAIEREEQNRAQFETVLDTSFNGIIKINMEGNVIVINKLVEDLIGKDMKEVAGTPLEKLFPQIDMAQVRTLLNGESESYMTSVNIRSKSWALLMAPIQYDGLIAGAILSLQKLANAVSLNKNDRNDMLLNGFVAQTTFQNVYTESKEMKKVLESAKMFALSDSPVLIYGQAGVEDYLMAESIHNNSNRKAGPYVSINVSGMDREKQMEELFYRGAINEADGSFLKGAMLKANHGTLFIKGIEHLTLQVQQRILRTKLSRALMRTDAQPIDALDVRIIGFSKQDLKILVHRNEFNEELYYMMQGLMLKIPSLNDRPEDLMYFFAKYIKDYAKLYNKYFVISESGYNKIKGLRWSGNLIQLKSFCERLAISAERRMIDEVIIQKLFTELYPELEMMEGEEKVVIYQSPEGLELSRLLEKFHGNRTQVAKELGISTTTLWRHMKKYGIETKY